MKPYNISHSIQSYGYDEYKKKNYSGNFIGLFDIFDTCNTFV